MYELTNIVSYRDNDVLSGRGSAVNNHPGNRFLQELVKSLQTHYVATVRILSFLKKKQSGFMSFFI